MTLGTSESSRIGARSINHTPSGVRVHHVGGDLRRQPRLAEAAIPSSVRSRADFRRSRFPTSRSRPMNVVSCWAGCWASPPASAAPESPGPHGRRVRAARVLQADAAEIMQRHVFEGDPGLRRPPPATTGSGRRARRSSRRPVRRAAEVVVVALDQPEVHATGHAQRCRW